METQKKKRQINKLTAEDYKQARLADNFVVSVPLFQSVDGGKTTDIDKAVKDESGNPVCLGYSPDEVLPHSIYSESKPIVLDANDPNSVLTAMSIRENLQGKSIPQVYLDKTQACLAVNSQLNNFESTMYKAMSMQSQSAAQVQYPTNPTSNPVNPSTKNE